MFGKKKRDVSWKAQLDEKRREFANLTEKYDEAVAKAPAELRPALLHAYGTRKLELMKEIEFLMDINLQMSENARLRNKAIADTMCNIAEVGTMAAVGVMGMRVDRDGDIPRNRQSQGFFKTILNRLPKIGK